MLLWSVIGPLLVDNKFHCSAVLFCTLDSFINAASAYQLTYTFNTLSSNRKYDAKFGRSQRVRVEEVWVGEWMVNIGETYDLTETQQKSSYRDSGPLIS